MGPDGTTVLWALYTQIEIITKALPHWIPPHDFILGVGIMAFNQNTLLMTSVWIDLPLRYHMEGDDFICGKEIVCQTNVLCFFGVFLCSDSL